MANINVAGVQAWLESTKSTIGVLDDELEVQVSSRVKAKAAQAYDTLGWVTPETTPQLIRMVISMLYAAWWYDSRFSADNEETNNYAALLRREAEQLLEDIATGIIDLDDVIEGSGLATGTPSFYPNDASSLPNVVPTDADPSAGGPYAQMGQIF